MISRIKTKGFIGLDINQQCGNKNLFIGANRSGKTTRTNAIHLVLNGFVSTSHKTYKKASDILNQYAKGDTLTCAIEIDGTEFEYHIYKKESGTVSKRFRIDKAKYSEKDFMSELAKSGDPRIIDLPDFIGFSDTKKVDALFKLYPADIDIKKLNRDITKKEAAKNKFTADIKTKKAVIRENTMAKNGIELPAGTLAEVKTEIENITGQILAARKLLKGIEIKEAKKEAVENSQAGFDNAMEKNTVGFESSTPVGNAMPGFDSKPPSDNSYVMRSLNEKPKDFEIELTKGLMIYTIQKIIDCMIESDCTMCTAMMVAKAELRKYK